jgi:transcriptional/translational regulatory protein YebC/TACO1
VEYHTDAKTKILQDARVVVTRSGGRETATGFMFERKGKILFEEKDGVGEEDVLVEAIEAGATEVGSEDGQVVVETEPADLMKVSGALQQKLGLVVERAEIVYDPKDETMVEIDEEKMGEVERIVEKFEEETSLQGVYLNAKVV